jgi:hypothetical protein
MPALHMIEIPRPDQNTIWVSKEFGIRSRDEFVRRAGRSWGETTLDVASTQIRGVGYAVLACSKRYDSYKNSHVFPRFDDTTPLGSSEKTEKVGLAILFHGLNGQPSLWDDHIALLQNYPALDLFAPEVPDAGHRSLTDQTSQVLLQRIVDWTNKNPGKPVAFFGQSNGTRFALLFETWLRVHTPKTPVHVSLTTGVLFGTSSVDMINTVLKTIQSTAFTFGHLSQVNCAELAFGSDTARKLVGDARKSLDDGVAERDYVMYSSMHDVGVPDIGSGLPLLVCEGQTSKSERHYLVTNYGHNAIVTALAQKQVDDCMKWMNKFRNNLT